MPDISEYYVVGPSGLTALTNNALELKGRWIAVPNKAESVSVQLVFSGTRTAGVVTFKGCNDLNAAAQTLILRDQSSATSTGVGTTNGTSNSTQVFAGNVPYNYMRVRISTAYTGGVTLQASATFMDKPFEPVNGRLSAASASQRIYAQITDGTNSAAVKASTTAAATTDPSVVVQISPNQELQLSASIGASAATTNATSVKASAGTVKSLSITNTAAAARSFKLYNKASAPTVGTDVPVKIITLAAGAIYDMPAPLRLTTGVAFAITTNATIADTTAVAVNDVLWVMNYV